MSLPAATTSGAPRIRQAVPGDVAFLSSTWKQQYKFESVWANRIRWSVFANGHDRVVQRLLSRSSALIACDPETEDEIFGYLVYESQPDKLLHFAYTKPAFRHAGIFRSLLAETGFPPDLAGVEVTHATRVWFSSHPMIDKASGATLKPGRPGLEEKFKGAVYNPYRWIGME
jgi:hypothetical protein